MSIPNSRITSGLALVAVAGLASSGVAWAHDGGGSNDGHGPGANILHGEIVIAHNDGTQTQDIQSGVVKKATAESIKVKSSDGFTETYLITGKTKVRGGCSHGDNGVEGGDSTDPETEGHGTGAKTINKGDHVFVVAKLSHHETADALVIDDFTHHGGGGNDGGGDFGGHGGHGGGGGGGGNDGGGGSDG